MAVGEPRRNGDHLVVVRPGSQADGASEQQADPVEQRVDVVERPLVDRLGDRPGAVDGHAELVGGLADDRAHRGGEVDLGGQPDHGDRGAQGQREGGERHPHVLGDHHHQSRDLARGGAAYDDVEPVVSGHGRQGALEHDQGVRRSLVDLVDLVDQADVADRPVGRPDQHLDGTRVAVRQQVDDRLERAHR